MNLNKEEGNTKAISECDNNTFKESKILYKNIDKNDSMIMESKKSKLVFGKSMHIFFKKNFYGALNL